MRVVGTCWFLSSDMIILPRHVSLYSHIMTLNLRVIKPDLKLRMLSALFTHSTNN